MTGARLGREQFTSVLQHHRSERAALGEGESLPDGLEDRFLLGKQPRQCRMQVVECCSSSTGVANVVPRFVREPLHVVGKVTGEIDNGGAQARFRANATLAESRLDESREHIWRNLVEPHDRTGLIERPLWSNHL